ncbi:MAG: polymer-forming cytoskeletal protein [Suilimivivens sp.]
MGFFSDLKDDLSQAVNELMPEEEMNVEEAVKEEETAVPETASETVNGFDADLGAMLDKVETMEAPEETIYVAPAAPETAAEAAPSSVSGKRMVDEVAVLTDSMIINGNIATEGALDVRGSIVGNVEALGKLNITGAIQGNSQASEIYAEGARITGELRSAGSVKIGQSTVIIGNIYANSAVIAGAVKGDIDVKGPVILDSSAIVMGNIKSKAVQINNGAVIEGMCSQCYAEVNPTSFFEELKKMK